MTLRPALLLALLALLVTAPAATADVALPDCGDAGAILGSPGDDPALTGTPGPDVICGLGGDDVIDGGGGADIILGDEGNDRMVGGAGGDVFMGGDGRDVADYSGATAPVRVTLGAGLADDGAVGERDNVLGDVEVVQGGPRSDRLTGDGDADALYGGPGGGRDVLTGGGGDDLLVGGGGADTFDGGAGSDRVSYADRPAGVTVTLGDGANDGTGGGAEGDDVQTTVERVTGTGEADDLTGDAGTDELHGGGGADTLRGGPGDDLLAGGGGGDTFAGGTGNDLADYQRARLPVRVSIGGGANDGTSGGAEGDTVGTDVERIRGGAGDDKLYGNQRANTLYGGPGDDQLSGGEGDDTFFGGLGGDAFNGGAGTADRVSYTDVLGGVTVTVGAGANDGTAGGAEGDDVQGTVERVIGTMSDDVMTAGPAGTRLDGTGGTDLLMGGDGTDVLIGDDGLFGGVLNQDTMAGGGGTDYLAGGLGDDQHYARDAGTFDVVDCGAGSDVFSADATDDFDVDCENAEILSNVDTATTNEDTPIDIDVLANDEDLRGGTKAVIDVTQPPAGEGSATYDAAKVTYTPPADFSGGPVSFVYTASDGATGSGADVSVTVTPVNDAPLVGVGGPLSYTEGDGKAFVDPAATLSDVDDTHLESLTVEITSNYAGAQDVLDVACASCLSPVTSLTAVQSGDTLTISGTGTIAEYLEALQGVRYENTSDTPDTSARTLSYTANDGGADSSADTATVTVAASNDAPTDVAVTNDSVAENQPAGTSVGTLSAADADDTSHTFTLVDTGDDDQFAIDGTALKTAATFDREAKDEYAIRVKADDGDGGTYEEDLTISVTDVNEAPAFTSSATPSVAENTTSVVDVDASDPEGTSPTYSITGGVDAALFSVDATTGALTFNSAPDFENPSDMGVNNVYDVQVTATDGTNIAIQNVAVTVTNANDPPFFVSSNTALMAENTTAVLSVEALDPEGGTVTYSITGGADAADFTIDASSGALAFASAPNFEAPGDADGNGEYVVEVTATDGSAPVAQTVKVTITDENDAPTAANDSYSGAVGNTTAVLGNTASEPSVTLSGMSGNVPSANDTDEDGDTLTVVAETVPTTGGGRATLDEDGTFTYKPGPGDKNQTDTFTYKVSDGEATGNGTVSIGIENTLVWYVDGSAAFDGDGRSGSPYKVLTALNGAGGDGDLDGAGDYLFLYGGNTYSGGLPLESSQKLIGSPHGLSVPSHPNLVPASRTNPAVTNSAGDAIQLAGGSEVQRVNASGASGVGIRGTSLTTATVGSNTTVSNNSGGGIILSGAAGGDVSIASTVENQNGSVVSVANRSSGTVTLSGDITSGSGGVAASSNTGATLAFTGKLNLTRSSGETFSATGGGSVKATGSVSRLSSTSATAIRVSGTTIASGGLNFESISASGATNGIVLENTGSTAGLTVTGTGSVPSGGTITGSTGPGLLLSNTADVKLGSVRVTNGGDDGIRGSNVAGFALTGGSQVTNNGNASNENGLDFTNLTGTVSLTGATVTGSAYRNVAVVNDSGTMNATVSGGTYGSNQSVVGNDSIYVEGTGLGTIGLTVENGTFSNSGGDHVQVTADSVNTVTENVTIKGNTFSNAVGSSGGGVTLNPGGNALMNASVLNNSISGANLEGLTVDTPGSQISPQPATVNATISGNTIGQTNVNESGGGNAMGIRSNGAATVTAVVTDNSLTQYVISGLELLQNDGNGKLNAIVRNNTITRPATLAEPEPLQFGIFALIGSGPDSGTSCLDIGGAGGLSNNLTGSSAVGSPNIRFAMNGAATAELAGYSGGVTSNTNVNTYLAGRNTTPNGVSTTRSVNSKYALVTSCPPER